MNAIMLISIVAFVGVSALVGAAAMALRDRSEGRFDDRLDQHISARGGGVSTKENLSVLSTPLEDRPDPFAALINRFSRLTKLFEQADTSMRPAVFCAVSGGLAAGGWAAALALHSPVGFMPFSAILMGLMPLAWLIMRRRRRLKKFASQLSDSLELIARALRAGHSLQAGFHLVSQEMPAPIGKEFGRVFEEQNLGIPTEEALQSMMDRVPNLDLQFFVTSVVLQRQTGGDLAEILDKISHLIRERFKIWGQIQALTGEGRLSGVVLLALPPVLFLAVYKLNPDYIMMLFTDPMGKKMLAGAIILQVIGALAIRKIINIKV
jgi:tight adherence protein B